MKHTAVRFLIAFTLGILIAGMIAFNTLLIWVATGPRSLNTLSPYIEEAFAPTDERFSVAIGETMLFWDGWRHPIDIRLRDVVVTTKEGEVFSKFPQIRVGLDVLSLLQGSVLLRSLVVDKPVISLYQDENYHISFGPQTATPTDQSKELLLPLAAILEPIMSPKNEGPLRKLRYVHISGADVTVGNNKDGIFFETRGADFSAKRTRAGTTELRATMRMRYGDYQSGINSRFLFDKSQPLIDGTLEFDGIEPQVLARLFTGSSALDPISMPVSGSSMLSLTPGGEIDHAQFSIDGGQGTVAHKDLAQTLSIDWIHAEGEVSNNLSDIKLAKLNASIEGVNIQGEGAVTLAGDNTAIAGTIGATNIAPEKVKIFWPPSLAPLTRDWVTQNISGGLVTSAGTKINIQPGDLAKPILPREAIDAQIVLDKVSVHYLEGHPDAKNLSGSVYIDGIALNTDITSGDYMDATKLSNVKVQIDDLNLDNPYIKVALDVESSAKDVARFLALPRLRHAERLALSSKEIDGSVKGSASVGFNFFAPLGANGKPVDDPPIDFDIKGHVINLSQPGLLKKFDMKAITGDMAINNKAVEFTGKGEVNGADVREAKFKYLFEPESGFDTFIDVKASAPVESLPRFSYPAFSFLSGVIGVDASMRMGDTKEEAKASLDLAGTAINLTSLNWKKPIKEPATLDLTSEKKDGLVRIPSFHIKAANVDVKGSASLNKALSDFETIDIGALTFGATKLSKLQYEARPASYAIDIAGEVLDLSGYMESDDTTERNFSFEHFPAVQFKGDIKQVLTGKEREIRNFKGEVNCSAARCESANIGGVAGTKPFNARIMRSPKGTRQLSLRAEDAGGFLRALNIFDGMQGGDLTITGNYEETGDGKLAGRIDINEHMIKDAPVLARILSLASLTGFFDTLQGKGIGFTKLNGRFVLKNDVITFDNIRTYGPAMGMTLEGDITMPKVLLDLKGTIVPSYTLNSALGKVPLVGALLTGGKGEGVFAARYSVRGTDKNPDISVNPLSILTPGFLRGLFDIGSSDKKEEE